MNPGQHVASWRHPEVSASNLLNFDFYKQIAETAERGKFDMIFLADASIFESS